MVCLHNAVLPRPCKRTETQHNMDGSYKHFAKLVLIFLVTSSLFTALRQWHPTPVLLPGKSHGWRSLIGCSPRGHEESDTTERLNFHFSPSCIEEGNGNPLQCSCLENPRDGEAWWPAIYWVAQSQTRLKRLSRSSSSLNSVTVSLNSSR